ncbi:MAG: hypothetical protein ACO1OB_07980 [Archangium sp.]
MQLTPVQIAVMDSQKEAPVVSLPVRHLTMGQRAARGVLTMLAISLPAALFALLPPHFCQALVALIGGPIAGLIRARGAAIFEPADITCPKCDQTIALPKNLTGWPARFPCPKCRAMVELRPGGTVTA